uniref:SH3 domain-containing protein n=1 Tax=Macrostomum lignano TaxID=282301 RepID=A0A1I8GBH3_9PLAT
PQQYQQPQQHHQHQQPQQPQQYQQPQQHQQYQQPQQHHQHQMQRQSQPHQQRPLREYDVLHLASFTAGRARRLSPEEGLHKLQQMESSTGLWEMQCWLQLTQSALHIVDRRNGELMEQFALARIRQPVAFEGGGPRGYDSILLFSIEEPTGSWEMHIFNCPLAANSASRIAKEIHQLLQGERLPTAGEQPVSAPGGGGRQQRQQPPHQQNLQPGRNFAPIAESRLAPLGEGGGQQQQQQQDSERLVHILNRCFDEIEAFVGRVGEAGRARQMLQSGSAQSRGLLQMRARMPPTEQFVETLKKVKLALNLLGRLEGRIHQPNAPELVHFLFTPLAVLVDSLGGVDLPSRVLSPLLTRQAIALLKHCLSSRESELWYSLGPAWTCNRQQWLQEHGRPDQVPDYRLCFQDGWEPQLDPELLGQEDVAALPSPIFQAPSPRAPRGIGAGAAYSGPNNGGGAFEAHQYRKPRPINSDLRRRQMGAVANAAAAAAAARQSMLAPDSPPTPPHQPQQHRRQPINAGYYPNQHQQPLPSSWEEQQEQLRREAEQRGSRLVQSIHDKTGRNAKELSVRRGEILEVLDDSRNWWQLRNCVGEVGHAPYTILRVL